MSTQTVIVPSITTEIVGLLLTDGWHRTWAACQNAVSDEYGNSVSIHADAETVRVEFGYGLPGMVETLNLDPNHGANRIACVIATLAAPPAL